ncbi:MAG TPA: TonB family protein [Candidatus Sulfotelmatobacter sp.]|nr:TonB family protein [Candidatus Sulfotelmatobacter sp.]
MGYTALLFCPEEKTARTVTQVLSELEFTVEACSEPFAAVKKLMGQHFDAVVVDCDNEQNATLLFKSARNSASNQTSLAVAVVEGQAGVAKAFRIGANLVLTKPINIEQAKGTLRVARGLLRKSEPGKGAASAGASPIATANPAAAKAIPDTKAAAIDAPAPVFAAQADEVPVVKPTPGWPAAAVASTKPAAADDDLLDIDLDNPGKPDLDKAEVKLAAADADGPILPTEIFATRSDAKSLFAGSPATPARSGAASAPAPAREEKVSSLKSAAPSAGRSVPEKARASDGDDDVLESSAGTGAPSGIIGSAPTFTLGGETEAESSGGSKKIIIGIAAAGIVAAGLYFGWGHFQQSGNQPADQQTTVSTPAASAPTGSLSSQPRPAKPSAGPITSAPASEPATGKEPNRSDKNLGDEASAASDSTKPSSKAANSDSEDEPEPAPLMVKGGKVPAAHSKAAAEAPAPSLAGLAPAEVAPPNFAATEATFKPSLQTLNVSQGVSQGLLIKKVPPSYPAAALRLRIEGTVELLATISKTGEISQVKVLSGDSQLSKAATSAVKQWKYRPYLLNGEPVEIQTQISVIFKLPE